MSGIEKTDVKKNLAENKVAPIKQNISKLERVFKMSDGETIAMAIRDLLIRDKNDGID